MLFPLSALSLGHVFFIVYAFASLAPGGKDRIEVDVDGGLLRRLLGGSLLMAAGGFKEMQVFAVEWSGRYWLIGRVEKGVLA